MSLSISFDPHWGPDFTHLHRAPAAAFEYRAVDVADYGLLVSVVIPDIGNADPRLVLHTRISGAILRVGPKPIPEKDVTGVLGAVATKNVQVDTGPVMLQHPVLVPSPLADGQHISESCQCRHVNLFPGRIIDDQVHVDDGLCGQVRYGRGADMLDVQGDAWKRLRDQLLAGLKKDGPFGRIGRDLDRLDRRSAGHPSIFGRVANRRGRPIFHSVGHRSSLSGCYWPLCW